MADLASPSRRPFWGALRDRLIGRALGLPPETCSYFSQQVKIPLPDGAVLAADLFRPDGHEPKGTVLVRCPYGRSIFLTVVMGRIYAARGFQVLFVSSRGTWGSTGTFDSGSCEQQDGQDVVAWMHEQPWYTGRFATLGLSYLGFTQWALLEDPPRDMVAASIAVAPHDFAERMWGTGAFSLQQHINWSDMIAHQESRGLMGHLKNTYLTRNNLDPLMRSVPLEPALRQHFGDKCPWLFEQIRQPDMDAGIWARQRHENALEKASIPIFLVGTWHDIFFEQTLEQYHALTRRGCPVALRIRPGVHIQGQSGDTHAEILRWLETHLAQNPLTKETPAVRIYRQGDAAQWLEMPSWPPDTTPRELFLGPGGTLEGHKPHQPETAGFTFDPSNPTPTVGGALLNGGGSVDDTSLCSRHDVITFTSEPLTEPLDIFGPPSVHLIHSSDNPYCDLFVRLSIVDAKGRSHNVTERYRRIDASAEGKAIDMSMNDTAYRVPAGSRVRLVIAGGNFPKYSRNYGTGESLATGTTLKPARHVVHLGGERGSRFVLPVAKPT